MIKLNWISPLDPSKSSAARLTLSLVPELKKYADITVWSIPHSGSNIDKLKLSHLSIAEYLPHHWHLLNRADLTIFNLDPHSVDYSPITEIGRSLAGLVILHDFKFRNLFDSSVIHSKNRVYETLLKIGKTGTSPATEFVKFFLDHEQELRDNKTAGFALACIENSLGIMNPNEGLYQYFKHNYDIPVLRLPHTNGPIDSNYAHIFMTNVNLALSYRKRSYKKQMTRRVSSELAKWIDDPSHLPPIASMSEAISFICDQKDRNT